MGEPPQGALGDDKMRTLFLVMAASWISAAGATYKCVDEKGVTHIGDTPPSGCATVVMYEIGKSGNVLRKIDPTPTPEQVKAQQEEYERVKASLKSESEQKRKDMALLSTFSAEREFDMARDRNIEPIKLRIVSAQDRIKAVDKRLAEIEEEMEFYKAGKSKAGKIREAPTGLSADLQRVRHEKTVLVASIAGYEKEIEQTRAKFDADKKRWLDIKRGGGSAKPPEPAADAKPDKKPAKKS
jgi:Domain of unknown function (DUF4124)